MPTAEEDKYPRHRKPGRALKRARAWPPAPTDVPPPGTYPVKDLTGMSSGAASLLLHRARSEAESGAETCPHVVIARDQDGTVAASGPFATGPDALAFATALLEDRRTDDADTEFTLTVAPLFPQ